MADMSDENLWPILNDMVRILKGDHIESEATLDRLESELRGLPAEKLREVHYDLQIVIGQLARLALRIQEMS